ncbi:MAG: hypothetical protein O2854_10055, partial [Chloroflexi bacterium]|nr:hypothetical protein [Chloroflexota bacterium]
MPNSLTETERNLRLRGVPEPAPKLRTLRAGPVELALDGSDLRYIKVSGREILRQLYVALRDKEWNTIAKAIERLDVKETLDGFTVDIRVTHRNDEVDFSWDGRIEGRSDGTITYTMDGIANRTFPRARIGFCVLHPSEICAGVRCEVEHVDGTKEQGRFPVEVSPWPPFKNIRAISHEVEQGVWTTIRMKGETFEMEDQGNWTDASFKIYGTPLSLPWPVVLEKGTRVSQSVTISTTGVKATANRKAKTAVRLAPKKDAASIPLPPIGTAAPIGQPSGGMWTPALKACGLSHVRTEVFPKHPQWRERFLDVARFAGSIGANVQAAVFFSDEYERELGELAKLVSEVEAPVVSWVVFKATKLETPDGFAENVASGLPKLTPNVRIGVGSAADYCQLNRVRPAADAVDFVTYSITPQAHAFDDMSVMETPEAQVRTVSSAKVLYPGKGIDVGPMVLLHRFNSNFPMAPEGYYESPIEPRQASVQIAAWTAASVKHLAESDTERLTYFEAYGPRGLCGTTVDGVQGVFPAYHVLRDITEFASGEVIPSECSSPKQVGTLRLEDGKRTRVLVFSLT